MKKQREIKFILGPQAQQVKRQAHASLNKMIRQKMLEDGWEPGDHNVQSRETQNIKFIN